ncbi:hypothetical protein KJ766_00875 [Patescibacteria group bacterium]|nr:hypothetical protein [Patescibacteria group bacterium]
MDERQIKILSAIVEIYVRTASPVSSREIFEGFDLNVSSATIRNDMAVLEDAGYLRQPYTSAGRVPTEEGYRLYLKNLDCQECKPEVCDSFAVQNDVHRSDRELMKEMAKILVELTGETAVMALESDWQDFIGMSKLFEKPDFEDVETLRSVSTVVDRFDDVMRDIFKTVEQDVNVYIGRENPFGENMTSILVKYKIPGGMTAIMGLVGPLRMDYQRNMRLLKEARKLIEGDIYE